MERLLETHRFGAHTVVVVEHLEDDGISYSILVDGEEATGAPIPDPPDFEDVVRIFALTQRTDPHAR